MVMDATGRILPCCGAPDADSKLVFGRLEPEGAGVFNSERYLAAREFFATGAPSNSYSANCEWDQTAVNIGAAEIRRYFRAADPWMFDRRSLQLLSSW